MKLTFDPDSDMAYLALIEIAPGGVALTVMSDGDGIALDYDRAGLLVGIEIFDAKCTLPAQLLLNAEQARRERRIAKAILEPGNPAAALCECKGPRALIGNQCLRCKRLIHE